MLKVKVNVKNKFRKIDKLSNNLILGMQNGIESVLQNIKGKAIRLERGHNNNGILVEMIDLSNNEVKGRVFADPSQFMGENNISYLFFEYFGTGTSAEMEHIGTTKHFLESGYSEWFLPVSKIGKSLGYPIITIKGEQFYIMHGVKANHFLTDAEFQTRNENKDIIVNQINEMIKEVCK